MASSESSDCFAEDNDSYSVNKQNKGLSSSPSYSFHSESLSNVSSKNQINKNEKKKEKEKGK